MKIITSTIAFFLILFIFACQSNTKADNSKSESHFFAKSYVRYLQTEKELKAEISFKEGDTLKSARSIVLTDVSFEGKRIKAQNLGNHGIRFDYRKRGPYSEQYEFNYSGEQIGAVNHILKMAPITEFLIKEETISKKAGMTVIWNGEALTENQRMVLLFTDEENKAFPIEFKGPTPKPEITLPRVKTKNLSTGKGKLMLIKKQLTKTKGNNLTKISEMEFYTNNIDIEVVE